MTIEERGIGIVTSIAPSCASCGAPPGPRFLSYTPHAAVLGLKQQQVNTQTPDLKIAFMYL